MQKFLTLAAVLLIGGCGTNPAPATPGPTGPPPPEPSTTPAAASPTPEPSRTAVPIPREGPGTFTAAPGRSERAGQGGQLLRYRVEVEDGIEIDPAEFAAAADAILADPRGWTAAGEWSLQRVPGDRADFRLRLATPATVDRICGEYWLETEGELSCRAGDDVMINLKRWLRGVPHFDGDLDTYREYLINHEVGHRLGHGHVECPGEGELAPVMQTQTLGLAGCRPNGWPYPGGGS